MEKIGNSPDYRHAEYPVRSDIVAAHIAAWQRLASAGTWWTGAERIAIAEEARAAESCEFCRARRQTLSPYSATGAAANRHHTATALPEATVDVIHRIRTDASRLTRKWYRQITGEALTDAHYVELVAVIATVIAVDRFHDALGMARPALPAPLDGAPKRRRPSGAKVDIAWVPTIAPENLTPDEPDIYRTNAAVHIHRALSLVPHEVTGFFALDDVHYLPDRRLREFGREFRDLTHAQIELLAARVSALNRCEY